MPWIRRLLLLGLLPMAFISQVSYGRNLSKEKAIERSIRCNDLLEGINREARIARPPKVAAPKFNYEQAKWRNEIRNEFQAADRPETRGIDADTDDNLRRWTHGSGLAVFIIDPNPHAHKYIKKAGYHAKPAYLKDCKSIAEADIVDDENDPRGLVACHPMFFQNQEAWQRTKEELAQRQLFVDENNYYLVYRIDKNGQKKYFFSDMDLFAVFKMSPSGARPYFKNRLINQISSAIGLAEEHGIQHAPRQDYKRKADLGFKFPITAYIPGVENPIRINDLCDLKKLYGILNMNLEKIWSDYFSKNSERTQCSGR